MFIAIALLQATFAATIGNQYNLLTSPNCGICSYIDNKEYKFYNPVNLKTNKPFDNILNFAEEMGPSWSGHRAFCDNEELREKYSIINYLNQTINIKIIKKHKSKIDIILDKCRSVYANHTLDRRTLTHGQVVALDTCLFAAGIAFKWYRGGNDNSADNTNYDELFLGMNGASKYYKGLVKTTEIPPKCIPLISDSPRLNPYHPLLTPKNAATRRVKTFPFLLQDTAFSCPEDSPKECVHSIEKTVSVTEGTSYSITDGIAVSLSNAIGSALSAGNIDSFINEISNVIEGANSIQKAIMNGVVNTETVATSIKKIVELQLANSRTNTASQQQSQGTTDTSISQSNFNSGSSNSQSSSNSGFSNTMSQFVDEINRNKIVSLSDVNEHSSGWNIGGEIRSFLKGLSLPLPDALGTLGITTDIGGSLSGGYKNDDKNTRSDINYDLFSRHGKNTRANAFGSSYAKSAATNNFVSSGGFNEKQHAELRNFVSGKSESDTKESRKTDSIANAVENSKSNENHWSSTDSSSITSTLTNGTREGNTFSSENTESNSVENLKQFMNNIEVGVSKYKEKTVKTKISHTFYIPPGKTKVLAFIVSTDSTQMRWSCRDKDHNKPMFSEINQLIDFKQNHILAVLDRSNAENTFQIDDESYNSNNKGVDSSRITSNSVIVVNKSPKGYDSILKTDKYELVISNSGNMFIRAIDRPSIVPKWQTDTNIKRATDINGMAQSPIRMFINEMGHIMLQAEDMFTQQSIPPYIERKINPINGVEESNTFTTIWSTVPKHLRYQVGNPNGGYTLVLQDVKTMGSIDVDLVLYDGGGSKIWCARNIVCESPNANGYRFPVLYLVPTDFPTHQSYLDRGDPHNTIGEEIIRKHNNIYVSENIKCRPILTSGQGITSKNNRFKLILQETGNLIFKDGTRTMWETLTTNLDFAIPPYKMMLSDTGSLYVTDSLNMLVFATNADKRVKKTRFFISDLGELVVEEIGGGANGINKRYLSTNTVPMSEVYTRRVHVCYSNCLECAPKRPAQTTRLYANGSDYTSTPFTLFEGEKLVSENGEYVGQMIGHRFIMSKTLDKEYYATFNNKLDHLQNNDSTYRLMLAPKLGIYYKEDLIYQFPARSNLTTDVLYVSNDGSLVGVSKAHNITIRTSSYADCQSICVIL